MSEGQEQLAGFLEHGIGEVSVLVFGDAMLDTYYFGEVRRISPEAPVPVAKILREQATLGGAANVAHNLAALGCRVRFAGVAGQDENRTRVNRLMAERGIEYCDLVEDGRPTTTKIRVMGGHQQMLRLDFEESGPVKPKTEAAMERYFEQVLPQTDGIIISDYGKGVCTRRLCQYLISRARSEHIPLIVDPKGVDWNRYSGATCVTPNLKELGEAAKTAAANKDREVVRLAERVRRRFALGTVIVTRSEQGMSIIDGGEPLHIPTQAQEVFDVSGAGDTVAAVLGAALAAGIALSKAAALANLAAGVAVGKLGTYAVTRQELCDAWKHSQQRRECEGETQ